MEQDRTQDQPTQSATESKNVTDLSRAIKPELASARSILGEAIRFYRNNLQLVLGIVGVPVLLWATIVMLDKFAPATALLNIVIALVLVVMSVLAQFALMVLYVEKEKCAGIYYPYQKASHFLVPALWINTLVSIAALGGYILFIVPGVIISILLIFSVFILFTEDRRGFDAMTSSWLYVRGYCWPVLWRLLFFIIVLLAIYIPLGLVIGYDEFKNTLQEGTSSVSTTTEPSASETNPVGNFISTLLSWFVVSPLNIFYTFGVLKALRHAKSQMPPPTDSAKIRKRLMILVTLGVVILIAVLVILGTILLKIATKAVPTENDIPSTAPTTGPLTSGAIVAIEYAASTVLLSPVASSINQLLLLGSGI